MPTVKYFSSVMSDDPSPIGRLLAQKKSLLLANPGNFIPLTFQRRLSLASIDTAVRAVTFKISVTVVLGVVEGWIRALYAAIHYITIVKASLNLSRGAVQSA